ncbi:MAG: hypothetical protein MR483_05970 [Bacteroidales bacterium]|nr:hypothetical protein [Bacteroidales bacterium]
MQITANAWNEYITRLSRLNQKAGQLMREYIDTHGTESTDDLIAYAYGLVTKYGEGSAELACQMYDALAEAANAGVPAAEPAEPADYGEVARMVNATKNQNPANLPNGVSRLVKRAGADTTLKNAVRDGAEWAWVPHGDTCPFCITLASNGWQKASSKVLKGGHAEHIHANCDCEFAIRFDHSTTVAGYDPEKYLKQYRDAGGDINKMRRIDYAARKDAINAQKRAAYAARKNFSVYSSLNMEPKPVTMQSISNVKAFSCDTLDAAGQQQLKNAHKRLLMTASKQPIGVEVGRAYDLNMKPLTKELTGAAERSTVSVPKQNVPYIVIHTHPDSNIFSQRDLSNFANNVNLKMLTAVGNDGHVYAVEKSASFDAKAVKTLVSDLGESVNGIADQYDRKEISYQEVAESLNFLVRNCLSELEGYGVKFYE